eukprot:3399013-Rhodomonas_salina.2
MSRWFGGQVRDRALRVPVSPYPRRDLSSYLRSCGVTLRRDRVMCSPPCDVTSKRAKCRVSAMHTRVTAGGSCYAHALSYHGQAVVPAVRQPVCTPLEA